MDYLLEAGAEGAVDDEVHRRVDHQHEVAEAENKIIVRNGQLDK